MARYLYGETNPVSAPIATANSIAIGDLVGYDTSTNYVVKASDFAWTTDLATTQTAFALVFLGTSGQKKLAGEARVFGNSTDNIVRIDCSGVFECDATAATYEFGDFVGPAKDSGNNMVNTTVAKVSGVALAIGRVCENTAASATKVKIQLLSTLNAVGK
jgi:mRNA-degrading endonuclease toxin of MazEF toxin-antitoxin module